MVALRTSLVLAAIAPSIAGVVWAGPSSETSRLSADSPAVEADGVERKRAAEQAASESKQLFHLVRGLKAHQSALAYGEEAAVEPIRQAGLAIRDWLATATPESWSDRRNVSAIIVHVLGGGSLGDGRDSLHRAELTPLQRRLVDGVGAYSQGRFEAATAILGEVDLMELEPVVAAHVALASATLKNERQPMAAFDLLGQSALLAPGTLIEEAALRRRITLAAANASPEVLARAIARYVLRFPKSVYRRGVVDGLMRALAQRKFNTAAEIESVIQAVRGLDGGEQAIVLVGLSQQALAHGWLSAAGQAAKLALANVGGPGRLKEQAALYAAVADMFVAPASSRSTFAALDRDSLSQSDVALAAAAAQAVDAALAPVGSVPPDVSQAPPEPSRTAVRAQGLLAAVDKLLRRG